MTFCHVQKNCSKQPSLSTDGNTTVSLPTYMLYIDGKLSILIAMIAMIALIEMMTLLK
jgi:hypothetical protein